jgi:hypothetical protein
MNDEVVQSELQQVWGSKLTALTPQQRKIVLNILKSSSKINKFRKQVDYQG